MNVVALSKTIVEKRNELRNRARSGQTYDSLQSELDCLRREVTKKLGHKVSVRKFIERPLIPAAQEIEAAGFICLRSFNPPPNEVQNFLSDTFGHKHWCYCWHRYWFECEEHAMIFALTFPHFSRLSS